MTNIANTTNPQPGDEFMLHSVDDQAIIRIRVTYVGNLRMEYLVVVGPRLVSRSIALATWSRMVSFGQLAVAS